MRAIRRTGIVIAVVGSLAAPPAADATTATIGSVRDPSSIGMGDTCSDCRVFQSSTDASSPSYVVPAGDWIVTSWSTAIGATPVTGVGMLMLEHAGGTMYTLRVQNFQNATQVSSVNTFPVQIPVQPGWLLGFDTGSSGTTDYSSGRDADVTRVHSDGTIGNTTDDTTTFMQVLVNVSATLESDCDDDGLGDDTQDPELTGPNCPPPSQPEPQPEGGDVNAPVTTITKGPKNKTKKKTATFEFTGTDGRAIAGFECKLDARAFAPCTSPHTVRVKKGKHTFQVRAIDQAGNVGSPATDTWKRKKKHKK